MNISLIVIIIVLSDQLIFNYVLNLNNFYCYQIPGHAQHNICRIHFHDPFSKVTALIDRVADNWKKLIYSRRSQFYISKAVMRDSTKDPAVLSHVGGVHFPVWFMNFTRKKARHDRIRLLNKILPIFLSSKFCFHSITFEIDWFFHIHVAVVVNGIDAEKDLFLKSTWIGKEVFVAFTTIKTIVVPSGF